MEVGRTAAARIGAAQADWDSERIAAADRAAVYAVATAERMGRTDLVEVRVRAATQDESDAVVRLARWFDARTYPPPAPMSVSEALAGLEGRFRAEVVAAFHEVQPLIQPVGME